jgi:TetR/AcrR family transcriptional regulator
MAGNDHKPDGDVDLAVRERLLEAAVDAFAAFGFEGASLRQIAQKAGVAFQLITYYFGSKEDLWIASVDYLFDIRVRAAKTTYSPVKDFEKQLREWLRIALHFSIQEPQLRQIMCQEYLAGSERYDKHLKPRLKEASLHFDYLFDQAQKQGINARLSSKEMMLVLRGIMVMAAVMPDNITSITGGRIDSPRTIDVLTDLLANIFVRGEGTLALRNQPVPPND